jgi:putative Mg2+ transporter-C (MgtC) family protein
MSDLGNFTFDIVAALVMGMAIGLERQYRQHPAGLRTNALVCVGAALFVSISRLVSENADPTRIAGQVVSGMGFLGGGVILREGLNVRGMNTAATLWCSAAVGSLAGANLVAQAAIGTVVLLAIHIALRPVVRYIDEHARTQAEVETVYHMRVTCAPEQEGVVRAIFMRHVNSQAHMTLQGVSTQATDAGDKVIVAEIYSSYRNDPLMNQLVSRISIEPHVSAVSWERTR